MKNTLLALVLTFGGGLLVSGAHAQSYVYNGKPTFPTGQAERVLDPNSPIDEKGEVKADPSKSVPPIATAKPYGVFVMIGQKGLVAISPFAPASLGFGAENLTSTAESRSFSTVSGDHQGVFPYGGLVFFGWEF